MGLAESICELSNRAEAGFCDSSARGETRVACRFDRLTVGRFDRLTVDRFDELTAGERG